MDWLTGPVRWLTTDSLSDVLSDALSDLLTDWLTGPMPDLMINWKSCSPIFRLLPDINYPRLVCAHTSEIQAKVWIFRLQENHERPKRIWASALDWSKYRLLAGFRQPLLWRSCCYGFRRWRGGRLLQSPLRWCQCIQWQRWEHKWRQLS